VAKRSHESAAIEGESVRAAHMTLAF
jgi:hypothetical protein